MSSAKVMIKVFIIILTILFSIAYSENQSLHVSTHVLSDNSLEYVFEKRNPIDFDATHFKLNQKSIIVAGGLSLIPTVFSATGTTLPIPLPGIGLGHLYTDNWVSSLPAIIGQGAGILLMSSAISTISKSGGGGLFFSTSSDWANAILGSVLYYGGAGIFIYSKSLEVLSAVAQTNYYNDSQRKILREDIIQGFVSQNIKVSQMEVDNAMSKYYPRGLQMNIFGGYSTVMSSGFVKVGLTFDNFELFAGNSLGLKYFIINMSDSSYHKSLYVEVSNVSYGQVEELVNKEYQSGRLVSEEYIGRAGRIFQSGIGVNLTWSNLIFDFELIYQQPEKLITDRSNCLGLNFSVGLPFRVFE